MKNKIQLTILVIGLVIFGASSDFINGAETLLIQKEKITGFVFVKISKIYHNDGVISIINEKMDTILYLKNKQVKVGSDSYEIIDQEYLYRQHVKVQWYNPEYGLFVLKCFGRTGDSYKVEINGQTGLINSKLYADLIEFKNLERYVLEASPVPTEANPIRKRPNTNSNIIEGYLDWTYNPVKIEGDWLMVEDDKECYKGIAPSTNNIVGWIKWKANGKLILKVALTC